MSYLLAMSIGPVQDFIAPRKTRDLWYGSRLLSNVARATAGSLATNGAELVFPHAGALDKGVGIANKVLAIVPDGGEPRELFAMARAAAQGELDRQVGALFAALGDDEGPVGREIDLPLLRAQVAQFLEIYGAWYPYERDEDYPNARREVDRLLDGRTALRDFAQPAFAGDAEATPPNDYWQRQRAALDGRPKSALDPARDSVLRRDLSERALREMRRRYHLKPGEELDGLSLIKRRAAAPRFVSTARIALDPFIRRLHAERPDLLGQLRDQAALLAEDRDCPAVEHFGEEGLAHYAPFPFDTQHFYGKEGADREIRIWVREGSGIEEQKRRALDTFYELVRDARAALGIGELPAFYAILRANGDRMGRAIGGMTSPQGGRSAHRAHQQLSQQLADFAGQAEAIVAVHHGALVYSGGDDVLAFLPLDTALACADALRRAFVALVQPAVAAGGSTARVSLSVGVAIVHYSEPLDEALGYARAAEQAAKGPRDALAVALHTRTGGSEHLTVVSGWADEPVQRHWHAWINRHWSEALPDSAAYDLQQRLWRQLAAMPPALFTTEEGERLTAPAVLVEHPLLIPQEVARIFRSKRGASGEKPLARALQRDVLDRLTPDTGMAGRGQTLRAARRQLEALRQIIDELLIARHLTSAVTVARGSWHGAKALPTEVAS